MKNKDLRNILSIFFTNKHIKKHIASSFQDFRNDEEACEFLIGLFTLKSFKEFVPIFFQSKYFLENKELFRQHGIIKNDVNKLRIRDWKKVFLYLDENKWKEPIEVKGICSSSCEVNAYVANNINAKFEGGKGTIICVHNSKVWANGHYNIMADATSCIYGLGDCHIEVSGLSTVIAYDNCHIVASGDAMVIGNDKCVIEGKDWSRIRAVGDCKLTISDHCSCIVSTFVHVEASGHSFVNYHHDSEFFNPISILKRGKDVIVREF